LALKDRANLVAQLEQIEPVMATLVTKLSFVTRVAISGVWLTSHTGF
jgi:hypothetical protein